jgi:hypothetical protein
MVLKIHMLHPALQRTNAENSKQIFREKELRGHSPNLRIHVSVSDLYISAIDLPVLVQENIWTDPGYKPLTDILGLRGHTIPRKGIQKWDFLDLEELQSARSQSLDFLLYGCMRPIHFNRPVLLYFNGIL